jgi:hypothetical protein
MITRIVIVLIIVSYCSCIFEDKPMVRKRTEVGEVKVEWYYYSRLGGDSPDYVSITKKGKKVEIFEALSVVTDVIVVGKSIIIKLHNPKEQLVFSKNVPSKVFDYVIILDSSATSKDLSESPHYIK